MKKMLPLLLLTAALPLLAAAPKQGTGINDQEVAINGDLMDFDVNSKKVSVIGNVEISNDRIIIQCDNLIVLLDEVKNKNNGTEEVKLEPVLIIAKGEVKFWVKKDPKAKANDPGTLSGLSEKVTYNLKTDEVLMEAADGKKIGQRPTLVTPERTIRSNEISFQLLPQKTIEKNVSGKKDNEIAVGDIATNIRVSDGRIKLKYNR